MSYVTKAVLERIEPQDDEYDIVRVVGVDSNKYPEDRTGSDWVGGPGTTRVLVTPHEGFGETISVPEHTLNRRYRIVSEPDPDDRGVMPAVSNNPPSVSTEPSPEQVFGTPAPPSGEPTPEAALANEPAKQPGEQS